MTFGEILYLALVIAAFSGFGGMLAYTDYRVTKATGVRPLQLVRDAKKLSLARSVQP